MFPTIIISHDVAWSVDDVRDGLTHRYYGLYSNLAKYVLKRGDIVFWYSAKRRRLFLPEYNISSNTHLMLVAVMKGLMKALAYGRPVIILLDYPHSFLGVNYLIDYTLTLILMHIFRFLTRHVFVVVDNMDPPIEHAIELSGRINPLQRPLWMFLNHIVLRFDLIVFHSQSYRIYHKLYYGLGYEKSTVIPPGSFPDTISYENPPPDSPIRVLCSGGISEWVGLENLMEVVKKLKDKGITTEFMVLDKSMPTKLGNDNIRIVNSYMEYREFVKILAKAHFLLLIRPNSLHHLLTVRATLADYIMAGRPVLYLRSLGMREIAGNVDWAFEFTALDEIPSIISQLVSNGASLEKLSRRVRAFAERYLNYRVLALKLLREILTNLRKKVLCDD